MIRLRPAAERFHTRIDWLDSWHSFSFGEHQDAAHMGFRSLRVINEDRVRAGAGFPTHPHRDMEILSYVLEGALEHKDSMGNRGTIKPGEVQRMTAGTGVLHSELNPSKSEGVHFLQIWILPDRKGLPPGYAQEPIAWRAGAGALARVAGPEGRGAAVTIHQDAELHAARLVPGERVRHALRPGRHAWIQVARGVVTLEGGTAGSGAPISAGDGASVSEEAAVEVVAQDVAEILLFDLA